jgi:hypothetical protein
MVTVSFAVTGQPNIAVGFIDVDPDACNSGGSGEDPLASDGAASLGSIVDDSGQEVFVDLVCDADGVLSVNVSKGGEATPLTTGKDGEWSFTAVEHEGVTWRTSADLLDIM